MQNVLQVNVVSFDKTNIRINNGCGDALVVYNAATWILEKDNDGEDVVVVDYFETNLTEIFMSIHGKIVRRKVADMSSDDYAIGRHVPWGVKSYVNPLPSDFQRTAGYKITLQYAHDHIHLLVVEADRVYWEIPIDFTTPESDVAFTIKSVVDKGPVIVITVLEEYGGLQWEYMWSEWGVCLIEKDPTLIDMHIHDRHELVFKGALNGYRKLLPDNHSGKIEIDFTCGDAHYVGELDLGADYDEIYNSLGQVKIMSKTEHEGIMERTDKIEGMMDGSALFSYLIMEKLGLHD